MGNATDTMTGLFNSFLRLSVALVVLIGLSAGSALGQVTFDPSQPGSQTTADYGADQFQQAIDDAINSSRDIEVVASGATNASGTYVLDASPGTNPGDEGNVDLVSGVTDGSGNLETVTVQLDQNLDVLTQRLRLEHVNLEFPGNNISLLGGEDRSNNGNDPRVLNRSGQPGAVMFTGDGRIETENPSSAETFFVSQLSVSDGATATLFNSSNAGDPADVLRVGTPGASATSAVLDISGTLDLGGNDLLYREDVNKIDVSGVTDPSINIPEGGTVENGNRFTLALQNSGSAITSFTATGEGSLNVPFTYDQAPSPSFTTTFEFKSIGQFGFSNFGTAGPVGTVEFPNLTQVRANIQIEGSDTDVLFESDVTVDQTNILSDATVEAEGSFTGNGDVEIDGSNTTATFDGVATFNAAFTANNGATVDFNNESTFDGATRFDGNSSIDFNAPGGGVEGTSEINGTFDLTNGAEVDVGDGTAGGTDDGLHNLEINGDATFFTGGATIGIDLQDDGDETLNEVRFAGSSDQDLAVNGSSAAFDLARVTVENTVELTANSGGTLEIPGRLTLEDGDFLANGNLDMSGATLIRSSTGSGTGRLQDGTSNIAYNDPANRPDRIEYVGSDNIPTGDELLPASADSSERTVGEFVVRSEEGVATTLATDYLYTVTSSLEIRRGDLAFSDESSLRLANMSTFVRGDGRLITEELVDPEEALRFPDVADADVGTDGIDLSYVNTTDDEDTLRVGIEWPDQDENKNVVRNVYVHGAQENEGDVALRDQDGGQSTYRLNGDFALGAGTFYFNGQNLEANAQQSSSETFAIADGASVDFTPGESSLRFVGPDNHAVLGVNQSGNDKTFHLPTTVVEKDPANGDATIAFGVFNNPPGEPNGFEINENFVVESAGNDLSATEGFFGLQLDEFTVTENFTQNAGSGVIVANSSFKVTSGDLTKATDDTSTTLLAAAGNRIYVGGDVTHSGATDSLFVNNIGSGVEGGLVMWTVGTSDKSTIDIGGSVTQEDGYASMATTFGTQSFTPQVNVGGDVTVNGGQFLFDNPFNVGPVASERVNIEGELAVNEGQFSGNLLPYSNINRRETLAAGALTVGTDAEAEGNAKADVAEQPEDIVASLYAGRDSYGDLDDEETFSDIGGSFPEVDSTEDDGFRVDGPEIFSNPFSQEEEVEESSLSATLTASQSGPGAKSAHEGDYDRFDIDGATTIATDGRFLLGAHSLEVEGDFTFEGQGDLTTNNSTAPQTGLAGLVTFDSDSEQAVTVGDGPNQYLHGVAVDGEEGINLQTNLTLSRASTDTSNTVEDQFDRAFGTLFLERGNVVTGEDSLKITQPTPTADADLAQALNADEISVDGTAAPQSPVIGGTRNSHIEGTLQRAVEDQGGSTGGFVTDGYIYPLGDGENYNGIVLQLPTDLGDTQTFTVSTVEEEDPDPLPENLTSEGIDPDTGDQITLDLNVQTGPYYEIDYDEEPDEDFNIRAIAGELSGATIDDIKQMRLVQFDTTATGEVEVQEAGRYDFTGDPNDDIPFGPNSFISAVPNVVHEGVDLREGDVIGLASDTEYNLLGPGAPSFTAVPSDQDLNVGESAEVTFTAEDSNTDVADLSFETSSDVNVSSSSKSGNDFTVTVEPDSADAEESFVQGGADNALDLTVEVTDSVNNTASATVGVTVGLQNGDANSSGSVNTEDASTALDAFLDNVSLTAVQTDAADQNGDDSVTPFDAAEILQIALGGSSAQVAKAGDASAGTVVIGDADRSDGTTTLPVELTGDAENVRSVAVEIDLDGASQQEVKNVATNLPSGWIADHESSSDGTLKIGMAGSSALSAGEIATIQLQGADDPADETSGTFRLNGSDAQDLEVQVSPESFALNGNYPNPFSTATTISYDLKEAVNVSIEVYDVLGRKVGTLVNKKQSAGSYEVTLNRGSGLGAQMSSGVYVYRIKAGDFTASEKMTVVR